MAMNLKEAQKREIHDNDLLLKFSKCRIYNQAAISLILIDLFRMHFSMVEAKYVEF